MFDITKSTNIMITYFGGVKEKRRGERKDVMTFLLHLFSYFPWHP